MEQTDWYLYILRNYPLETARAFQKWYCGVSQNPMRRLADHNSGRVAATKGRQWRAAVVISGLTTKQVFYLEHWLKSGDTRKKRTQILNDCRLKPRPVDWRECAVISARLQVAGLAPRQVVPADEEYCPHAPTEYVAAFDERVFDE